MSKSPHRSFERITLEDLDHLAAIAVADFENLFKRKPYSGVYAKRLLLICVCQGAARHYTHGDRGVHDFDVWGFFKAIPGHPFPYRRQGQHDFGPSKFGHDPELGNKFVGRQVGVFGRSISKRAAIYVCPSTSPANGHWLREPWEELARAVKER